MRTANLFLSCPAKGQVFAEQRRNSRNCPNNATHGNSRAAFDAHALLYLLYGEEFEVALPLLPDAIAALLGTNNLGSFAFKTADDAAGLLEVSPNPATAHITVAALPHGKSGHLSIYTADGRLAQMENIGDQGDLSIDLSAFGSGIYVLRLQLNDGTTVNQKLVIAR